MPEPSHHPDPLHPASRPERPAREEPGAARHWRLCRLAYLASLLALFAIIALYVGPNMILFGKPAGLSPRDFIPVVERDFVPLVRAMKEFERDHGRRPQSTQELTPGYVRGVDFRVSVRNGEFSCRTSFNHQITYSFGPADEGWRVRGPFTSGRIPLPPVTIAPGTRPATRSN